jgi:alkyldihydroxyacetonephosphate synthase
VVTPRGVLETRRLPGSGAGPSAERLFCGSEGTLGVITEAWMRVQPRPRFRAGASVRFARFGDAVEAARELAQSGLHPANCRLLDHEEALLSGSGDGSHAILVLGFESADHELGPWLGRALEICAGHRGEAREQAPERARERVRDQAGDPAAIWRAAFLRGPHLRDAFVRLGLVVETFETAVTWDRFGPFHEGVLAAVRQAMDRACGGGVVTCRFAYVYPDGPAPYYSVYAPGRPGAELEQWDEIKLAASETILALGGTITHHHAVGRDHRRWYLREVPPLFTDALRGAKAELDPAGIMNPGVLMSPAAARSGR